MNPLIDNFSKNLKPCSGCGSNGIWQSIPIKENIMQYAVTVIIEAENLKSAVLKVPDDLGEVASATPRPQPQNVGQVVRGTSGVGQPAARPTG